MYPRIICMRRCTMAGGMSGTQCWTMASMRPIELMWTGSTWVSGVSLGHWASSATIWT